VLRILTFLLSVVLVNTAVARGPAKTECVSGDGSMLPSFDRSVEFVVDASQNDPTAPVGEFTVIFRRSPGWR